MRDDPLCFASLLSARLCHDLLGPVGALGNGLELLALDQDPATRRQTVALMTASAASVAAKLKFFRLAFGTGGDMTHRLPLTDVRDVIHDFFAPKPQIRLTWMVEGTDLPHPMARLLLIFAMLAGDALVRGGNLDIAVDHKGELFEIVVRASGERVVLNAEDRDALESGSAPDLVGDARSVPAQLAARLADRFGMTIGISPPDSAMLLLGTTAQI